MSSAQLASLMALSFGALCMLLGFFLIVRGIGDSDSESSVKVIGVEIRASKVGPGVVFAMFGLVIAVVALSKFPSDAAPAATNASAKGPTANNSDKPTSLGERGPDTEQHSQRNDSVARTNRSAKDDDVSSAKSLKPRLPGKPITPPFGRPIRQKPAVVVTEPEVETVNPTISRDNDIYRKMEAELLRRALAEMAKGKCPHALFEANVSAACDQQIANLATPISIAGPVQSITYVSSANGQDTFRVNHVTGGVRWQVALSGQDKFIVMLILGPG